MAWEDIDGASMAVVSVEDAGDSVLVSGRGAGSIGTPPGWAGGGLGVRGQVLRAVREAPAPAPTSQMTTRPRSSETCWGLGPGAGDGAGCPQELWGAATFTPRCSRSAARESASLRGSRMMLMALVPGTTVGTGAPERERQTQTERYRERQGTEKYRETERYREKDKDRVTECYRGTAGPQLAVTWLASLCGSGREWSGTAGALGTPGGSHGRLGTSSCGSQWGLFS